MFCYRLTTVYTLWRDFDIYFSSNLLKVLNVDRLTYFRNYFKDDVICISTLWDLSSYSSSLTYNYSHHLHHVHYCTVSVLWWSVEYFPLCYFLELMLAAIIVFKGVSGVLLVQWMKVLVKQQWRISAEELNWFIVRLVVVERNQIKIDLVLRIVMGEKFQVYHDCLWRIHILSTMEHYHTILTWYQCLIVILLSHCVSLRQKTRNCLETIAIKEEHYKDHYKQILMQFRYL